MATNNTYANSVIYYQTSRHGQTLLEIIVAVGVAVLLITGLVVGTSVSLRTSQYGQHRSKATKYAQEGIEIIRNIRDREEWDTFIALDANSNGSTTNCLGDDGIPSDGPLCDPNLDTIYTRDVIFLFNDGGDIDGSNDRMEVTVTVLWLESGQPLDVRLDTYFTKRQ